MDQRGGGGGRRGGGLPVRAGGGLGLVGILVVVALQLLGGGGGFAIDQPLGAPGAGAGEPIPSSEDPDHDLRDFSANVFTDAQERWERTFAAQHRPYERAKLVLFADAVSTGGCGEASSAVGHHVQRQSGLAEQVERPRRDDPDAANDLSVRQELQADCYAGVRAAGVHAAGQLEEGDVDEAFVAAESVGDDRLQRSAGREVDRDSFTHGSSEQRRRWFDAGRREGDPAACDTLTPDEV